VVAARMLDPLVASRLFVAEHVSSRRHVGVTMPEAQLIPQRAELGLNRLVVGVGLLFLGLQLGDPRLQCLLQVAMQLTQLRGQSIAVSARLLALRVQRGHLGFDFSDCHPVSPLLIAVHAGTMVMARSSQRWCT
jgi:hypothetical protein